MTLGFVLLQTMVYSQQKVMIEGKIDADSIEDYRINILNITGNTGTTNSDSGEFKIEVQENDTLLFSSVQYERVQVKISKEILQRKFLNIALAKKVIDLDEVLISKTNLTGNLSTDVESIKTYNYYEGIPTSKIPRLTTIGRQLYTARDGDIDPLLNMISGRLQMLEKANKNEQLAMDVQKGIDIVKTPFFTDNLQIPDEEIVNFVFYCASSPLYKSLLTDKKYLELIDFFKEKAPSFKEMRGLEQAINQD